MSNPNTRITKLAPGPWWVTVRHESDGNTLTVLTWATTEQRAMAVAVSWFGDPPGHGHEAVRTSPAKLSPNVRWRKTEDRKRTEGQATAHSHSLLFR